MADDEMTLPARGLHRPGDDEVGPVIFETGDTMPQPSAAVQAPPQRLEDAPTDALEIVGGDAAATAPLDEPLSPEEQQAARDAAQAQLDAAAEEKAAQKPTTSKPKS